MLTCARVAIDDAPDLEFDYQVPDSLVGTLCVGHRVSIPLRKRQARGTVLSIFTLAEASEGLRSLSGVLHQRPILTPTLLRLAEWLADYYFCTREAALRSMLPDSIRSNETTERRIKIVKLAKEPSAEEWETLRRRAAKQADVLQQIATSNEGLPLARLANSAAVRALLAKGWITEEERLVERDLTKGEEFLPDAALTLSPEQETALNRVFQAIAAPGDHAPLLLHGITGSGKTEIYLRGVARALELGRTALVLVPEISLTHQTVERFKSRFADRQKDVAVLHSHLSVGERFDEWQRIHRGEAKVVIGARSALFAPLEKLGLIIVDEEHETSYKQDIVPRYHGRDLAVVRAKLEGCAVLLGSATPSLESYQNVLRGKYHRLELANRVDDRSMPLLRVVDMRLETRKQKGGVAILSDILRQAVEDRLAKGEQVILFLNRRGYASAMQCLECGHVCECAHCSASLTYHLAEERLICHICGYKQVAPKRCPKCKSLSVKLAGFGTERAEEVLAKVFPKIRMARVDADVMQRKNRLAETLRAFKAKKLDMLVGTQMIAKGLHFPNVTLVGILNADVGLSLPDFRAGERTFQLITQVAGRAGRGELLGEVIVQTFAPQNPAVQFARHHDFEGFAAQELELREQFRLPPFTHACLLHVRSRHEHYAEFTINNLAQRLRSKLPEGVIIGEPAPSPLARAASLYRFQVMLRARRISLITSLLRQVISGMTFQQEVTVVVDVDPFQLT